MHNTGDNNSQDPSVRELIKNGKNLILDAKIPISGTKKIARKIKKYGLAIGVFALTTTGTAAYYKYAPPDTGPCHNFYVSQNIRSSERRPDFTDSVSSIVQLSPIIDPPRRLMIKGSEIDVNFDFSSWDRQLSLGDQVILYEAMTKYDLIPLNADDGYAFIDFVKNHTLAKCRVLYGYNLIIGSLLHGIIAAALAALWIRVRIHNQ